MIRMFVEINWYPTITRSQIITLAIVMRERMVIFNTIFQH